MARDLIVDGELVLYGPVGGDWWDDSGFTAMDVIQSLAQMDGDITVRLNSGGGVAWDGVAIYNALKAYSGAVTVVVEGVAASAASIIAMAGDDVEMRAGALMMIHNASTITWGTAEDHEKSRELLAKLDGQLAAIYAERTGLDLAEIRALMDAETWMDAAEAIDKGFAGTADDEKAARASAFDYRLYAKAPKALQSQAKKLKAPAAAQPWGVPMNAAAPRKPAKNTPSAAPTYPVEASASATARDAIAALADEASALVSRAGGADGSAAIGLYDIASGLAAGMDATDARAAFADLVDFGVAEPQIFRSATSRAASAAAGEAARALRLAVLAAYAEALMEATFADRPSGIAARAEAAERFGAEMARCTGGLDAELFVALSELRGLVCAYLTRLITDLAPVAQVEAPRAMPSLWWAWRLYGDPARCEEITARNRLPHPSFVPRAFEALVA